MSLFSAEPSWFCVVALVLLLVSLCLCRSLSVMPVPALLLLICCLAPSRSHSVPPSSHSLSFSFRLSPPLLFHPSLSLHNPTMQKTVANQTPRSCGGSSCPLPNRYLPCTSLPYSSSFFANPPSRSFTPFLPLSLSPLLFPLHNPFLSLSFSSYPLLTLSSYYPLHPKTKRGKRRTWPLPTFTSFPLSSLSSLSSPFLSSFPFFLLSSLLNSPSSLLHSSLPAFYSILLSSALTFSLPSLCSCILRSLPSPLLSTLLPLSCLDLLLRSISSSCCFSSTLSFLCCSFRLTCASLCRSPVAPCFRLLLSSLTYLLWLSLLALFCAPSPRLPALLFFGLLWGPFSTPLSPVRFWGKLWGNGPEFPNAGWFPPGPHHPGVVGIGVLMAWRSKPVPAGSACQRGPTIFADEGTRFPWRPPTGPQPKGPPISAQKSWKGREKSVLEEGPALMPGLSNPGPRKLWPARFFRVVKNQGNRPPGEPRRAPKPRWLEGRSGRKTFQGVVKKAGRSCSTAPRGLGTGVPNLGFPARGFRCAGRRRFRPGPTTLGLDKGQGVDVGRTGQGLSLPLAAIVVVECAIFARDPALVGFG